MRVRVTVISGVQFRGRVSRGAASTRCGRRPQAATLSPTSARQGRVLLRVARPVQEPSPTDRASAEPQGVRVHRGRTLTTAHVRIHQGRPVTSPGRTVLDVAATLTDRDVERLLDEALFARRILTRADLRDVLARAGSHAGRGRLKRVARNYTRSTKTDSPPEERLLLLIRAS